MVPTDRSADGENIAVLAHGLLNPMSVVVGGIDVALGAGVDGDALEALQAARRQAVAVVESLRQLAQGLPAEVVAGTGDVRHPAPEP